jgi:flavin-dependent dehydrogenase
MMNPFGSGWHLDRAAFDESLREEVQSACNNSVLQRNVFVKGKCTTVRKDEQGWIVTAEEPESKVNKDYRSRWLVDASGRKASVARKVHHDFWAPLNSCNSTAPLKLGAKTVKLDRMLAFYAVFSSPMLDLDHRTFIEATETGWWYSSQVAHNKRIVVFHTDDCDPSSKLARKQEGFLDMLRNTAHISHIIGDKDYCLMSGVGTNFPRCTTAGSSLLEPFGNESDQWCAVGDSAIAFDPLSSQGIITALRMGCSVGIMLSKQSPHSEGSNEAVESFDLHSVTALYQEAQKDYEQKRRYFYGQSMFSSDFWQRRK